MAKKQPINVLLIIRERSVSRTLSGGLSEAGYKVTEYQTVREFLIDKRNHQQGVVLSEIRLLGSMGTELVEHLASEKELFPLVLIAKHADIPKAVKAGVDFVCGAITADVLAAAVERTLSPEVFKEKSLRWAFEHLSPRESEVLAGVLAGLASRETARELGISLKTVEVLRARINGKTRASDVGKLIRMWKAWQALQ